MLISVIAVTVGAAPSLAAPHAVPSLLVGTWNQGAGNAITFKSSGRVIFKFGSELIVEMASGTSTRVTFRPVAACTESGIYRWKRDGHTVTFHPVTESCSIRRSFLGGKWTRK